MDPYGRDVALASIPTRFQLAQASDSIPADTGPPIRFQLTRLVPFRRQLLDSVDQLADRPHLWIRR